MIPASRDAARPGRRAALAAFALALSLASAGVCEAAFEQINLVSSVAGLAPFTDANLKNPWGVAYSPTGPFWVANQVSGTATIYDGTGQPQPAGAPLVVTIPGPGGSTGPGTPTGSVFNPTSDFEVGPGMPGRFVFVSLDGVISAWNPAANPTTAIRMVDESATGASFTGLALGSSASGNFLYAADAAANRIRVYNSAFQPTTLGGTFLDPNLPAGFTVYNIRNLGGTLYVTYENETTGGGIVDAFDLNGNLLRRITGNAAGGPLDSPWGLAIAPAGFGSFGGALLVGNEGNGRVSAFNAATGQFLGQLLDAQGNPIANPGLWGLTFGNGGSGGAVDTLHFTAGVRSETEGLFGAIRFVTTGCVANLSGRGTPAGRAPARVDLTWGAFAGADHYDVMRGTASGGPYVMIGSTPNNYFSDTAGLVSGSTYYYVLQIRDAAGAGVCQSNEAKVTIPMAR